jgi:hypothetical protein
VSVHVDREGIAIDVPEGWTIVQLGPLPPTLIEIEGAE